MAYLLLKSVARVPGEAPNPIKEVVGFTETFIDAKKWLDTFDTPEHKRHYGHVTGSIHHLETTKNDHH
jgi:hypothetical protein